MKMNRPSPDDMKAMQVMEYVDELEKENKKLKKEVKKRKMVADENGTGYDMLEEENKKLKEDNRFLTKISKEYMKKENIIEVAEFTELYKDDLEEENKELKEKIDTLELCIKNKDELLEEYRKKIDKLRTDNIYEEGLYK